MLDKELKEICDRLESLKLNEPFITPEEYIYNLELLYDDLLKLLLKPRSDKNKVIDVGKYILLELAN